MGRQWYKSSIVKGILIVLEHVLAVFLVVSFLWMMSYPSLRSEVFSGKIEKEYENTNGFNDMTEKASHSIMKGISLKERLEPKGEFNPDRAIDLEKLTNQGKYTEGNGITYRLQDLLEWGKDWEKSGERSSDTTTFEDNIIVCKKQDGSFYYYQYSEFQSLIHNNELQFVVADKGDDFNENNILSELRSGNSEEGYSTEGSFKGIQDADGKIVYIDCWNYDGFRLEEKFSPINAKSLLEIANTSSEWNGRLFEAYVLLREAIYTVSEDMSMLETFEKEYQEGDTNLSYFYANTDTKQVYTNRKDFADYENIEESLNQIRKLGKYIIVSPKLADFQSNMKQVNAKDWQQIYQYEEVPQESSVFAIGVDTAYPIQDEFYTEAALYEKYGETGHRIAILECVALLLFIVILVWLTITAGRTEKGMELYLNGFDRIKTELAAAIIVIPWGIVFLIGIEGMGSVLSLGGSMTYQDFGSMVMLGGVAAFTCAMFLTGFLSLVRRIKGKTLWKNSVLYQLVQFVKKIFFHIPVLWKTILVFGIFILWHWFVMATGGPVLSIMIMIAAEIAAFVYLVHQAIGKKKIQTGIEKIYSGEVDYKISLDGLQTDQRRIAEKINSIGDGIENAVAESMKSERLKTDLITNVSHDIKTPLTSIINYVDLLKQENIDNEKIQRYIEILEAKSQRLKTLTEDVLEASKVSSGNISLEYMNINLVEMIQQTSGEFEEKFKQRNLKEVLSLPQEEAIIYVDGRRMWRVLENIYNNAAKYAMEGTRVYADLKVGEKEVFFSLKNISEQPLNISADELTERFIRGDISRSTEGSGLGLSIAKTLTEMQGGKFELYLDGDLFRVTIVFPLVK